jgi:hypothetical protein
MMQRTAALPTFGMQNESPFPPNTFSDGANSPFSPSQHDRNQWQSALLEHPYDQYTNAQENFMPFLDPTFMDVDKHAQFEMPYQPHNDNPESHTNLDPGPQIEMLDEDSTDPVDSGLESLLLSRYSSLRTDPTRLRNMVNNTKNSWEMETGTQSSNPASNLGNTTTPLESGKIQPSSPPPVRQNSFPQHEIEHGIAQPESVQSPYSSPSPCHFNDACEMNQTSPSSGLTSISFSEFLISDDDSPFRISSPKRATTT